MAPASTLVVVLAALVAPSVVAAQRPHGARDVWSDIVAEWRRDADSEGVPDELFPVLREAR